MCKKCVNLPCVEPLSRSVTSDLLNDVTNANLNRSRNTIKTSEGTRGLKRSSSLSLSCSRYHSKPTPFDRNATRRAKRVVAIFNRQLEGRRWNVYSNAEPSFKNWTTGRPQLAIYRDPTSDLHVSVYVIRYANGYDGGNPKPLAVENVSWSIPLYFFKDEDKILRLRVRIIAIVSL